MIKLTNLSNDNLSRLKVFCVGVLLLAVGTSAWAGETGDTVDWVNMGMGLFGGLALFLFGMEQMADALKAVAGERMKDILGKLTTNRFMGAITGAFVTAVIQSSSVTTVLVVGFITAGLMSLAQSVGVIMGANIGTTITAQIVAFKVTKAAMLMIGVGFFMILGSKKDKIKQYGAMVMGLGMIFFGMSVMSDAMKPLRSYEPFLDLMTTMENPLIAILVSAGFTGLIQSSSATTGIVIVMASQGFISLPMGIALAFGANIGTCVTALLASIGKPREAVRAGLVHVLFNVAGVLLWLGLIPPLAAFVASISPSYPDLTGTERLAAEAPRQIANAHTIFNVANTLIFIWFTGHLARLVERLVPDKPLEEDVGAIVKPKYLDEALLSTPSLALDRVRLEILHMGEKVDAMLKDILPAIVNRDRESLTEIERLDDSVDLLHSKILGYMGKISKGTLTDIQTAEFLRLMEAVNDLENIGDIVESGMVVAGYEVVDKGITISPSTQKVLAEFHGAVMRTVSAAVQAVSQNNVRAAETVTTMKQDIQHIVDSTAAHLAERLVVDEPNRIPTYSVEVDILEKLKRIYYFSKRMAKTVLPVELEVHAV